MKAEKKVISQKSKARVNYILYGLVMMVMGLVVLIWNGAENRIGLFLMYLLGIVFVAYFIWRNISYKQEKNDEMSIENWTHAFRYAVASELVVDFALMMLCGVMVMFNKEWSLLNEMDIRILIPVLIMIKTGFQAVLVGTYFIRLEEK